MTDDMRDDEVNELDELRRIGASAPPEAVAWDTPPPELWQRIADQIAETTDTHDTDDSADADDPVPTADPPVPASPTVAPIHSAHSARTSRTTWWLAAAAAVVLVVAAGVLVSRQSDDGGGTVLAQVDLERLGESGDGTAELLDRDGTLELRLDTDGLAEPDGFTEVWLINTELSELVSLGPLRSDGVYAVPTDLDPEAFPIVDVSFEPLDGDPQHSGNSVLRGTLTF